MALDIAALKAKAAASLAAQQASLGTTSEATNVPAIIEDKVTEVVSTEVDYPPTKQSETTAPVALGAADQIIQRINDLQAALQQSLPGYESILHFIHHELHRNEDVVHILTEDQIGVIVAGLSKKKNVVIATSSAKGGKTPAGKKLKDLDLADL